MVPSHRSGMEETDTMSAKNRIEVSFNGVLASELAALKGAPLSRLLLAYCLLAESVPL